MINHGKADLCELGRKFNGVGKMLQSTRCASVTQVLFPSKVVTCNCPFIAACGTQSAQKRKGPQVTAM